MNQDSTNFFTSPLKFNAKNFIILILAIIGLYLLVPQLVGLEKALGLLQHVNKYYLILALISELVSFSGAAWLLGIIFSRLGYKLSFITRFKLASIAAFAIHLVPLGAAGEAAFDYYFLRKQNVESGSIILMWILRLIFTYAGFFLIFLLGLALVPTYPQFAVSLKIISPVILVLILGLIFYLVYLYRHKNKFWRLWEKLFNLVNRFLVKFKKNPVGIEKKTEVFEDIYNGIGLFGEKKRTSLMAIATGALYYLGDITCFYFVFHAFGYSIGYGILIFSYCISTLIAVISAIPGGVGVTEGSMTLILTAMGIPATLALTAVLVFRVFSFWIWIPIGFFSYISFNQKIEKEKDLVVGA